MMALATHQVQGSFATLPARPLKWNREMELKPFVTKLHMVAKPFVPSLKSSSCLSVGAPFVWGPKGKGLKVSAFKGSVQNDELGGSGRGTKSIKNSVKLSYISCESKETLTRSPAVQNGPLSFATEADGATSSSLAIQNLFKNWITLLRTQSPSQVVAEGSEVPAPEEADKTHIGSRTKERGEILKAVWCYFLGLDATVKIPLLIFIPGYLAVNIIYGVQVSKELTPLWVLGPLLVALYITMLRGLRALYVFSFQQTIKVVKNLPTYYHRAHNYVASGKLKERVHVLFWNPLLDTQNLDYRELSKRKMKDLEVWLVEKYLDYVESVWPYYCRTIRFLKRANLI